MFTFATLIYLSSAVLAQVYPNNSHNNVPGPLVFDFTVERKYGDVSARDFWAEKRARGAKRDPFEEAVTGINDIYYMMHIYLGSNKQKNSVVLDTGSSDLWVPSTGFDPKTSTTAKDTGKKFGAKYVDGSQAQGEFYLDTFQFELSSQALQDFQFAVSSANGPGVLGIGNKAQEAALEKYDNLPWALANAGLIPRASYSLYLGGKDGKGTVVFGGVDTEKYECCLSKYPVHTPGQDLAIDVKSITIGGSEVLINTPFALDSGTSLGYAGKEVMAALDSAFNTTLVVDNGMTYRVVSCTQPTDKYFEFDFGANKIIVSYADMVMKNDDGSCILGLVYYQDMQILGDVFLKHAYVYFDLTEQTIALSQARYTTASNVIGV